MDIINSISENGILIVIAGVFYANSSYFILHSNQGSWVQGASVKSYDNDGFTLTWSKVGSPTAGTMDIKVICYK